MQFETQLTKGKLVKRYKRFLADVALEDGSVVTAHCANSGSMLSLIQEGRDVYLLPNTNPKAKLDWRWELIECDGTFVGINTSRPNAIVEEGITSGRIKELCGYETLRREVKYGTNSRIDILLENVGLPSCYVEVKNCTLSRQKGIVEFPDAVTSRGAKHLEELSEMVRHGNRSVMIYLVNRDDCGMFTIAKDIDSTYYEAFLRAMDTGVEAYAYCVSISPCGISVDKNIEMRHS